MNSRISFLKEQMFKDQRQISIERAVLFTESHKQTEGENTLIRRAKATEYILDNVKISIRPQEMIVGNRTVRPRSGIISPEMEPDWILKEIDTLVSRPQDKFEFTEKDKKIFKEELYPYWKARSMKNFIRTEFSSDIARAVSGDIISINQTDKGQGHIIPNYEILLQNGLQYMIDLVESKNDHKNEFYQASLITLKAFQRHIKRYEDLAISMAQTEQDPLRKSEYQKIATTLNRIHTQKPTTFFEACQLLWLFCVVLQFESNASSISLGRTDQYLYPFYEADLKNGVTKEELKETLEMFNLKTNDVVLLRNEHSARFFAGFPTGYTIIIGGIDKNGKDVTNDLSYLFLETHQDILLPQPNLSVRAHSKSDKAFLMETSKTIRLGSGIPQVFNDEVIIPSFLSRGVSLDDARDYAVVGCVEISLPGNLYGLHDIAMVNLLKIFEEVLYQYKGDKSVTYEKIEKSIYDNMDRYIELTVEGSNICDLGHRKFAPLPLLSTFMNGCIDQGLDLTYGGSKYNFSGVQGIGIANLSDSLYALKKVVFEEEILSYEELLELLENNWDSPKGKEIQTMLINKYAKYGNDIDEVDDIGVEYMSYFCKRLAEYPNIRGGIFIPGSYTVSAHVPLGAVVGATPDGRHNGEQLADGGLSPMLGQDKLGPTASLKSVSKLDSVLLTNGSLLNVKFSPKSLENLEGLNKLSAYLQAFVLSKVLHIQFNVITIETLKKAQQNPEKFANLVVRVAGYSAFFTELSKDIQDDIIRRTEHSL